MGIKVLFPDIRGAKSGRGHFLNALANELPKHDIEVNCFDEDSNYYAPHDVSLHSIRLWCDTGKPRILRLDGVYHDIKSDYKSANLRLKEGADSADGIVCQSEFSKKMVMTFLNQPEDKITVIMNGAATYPITLSDGKKYFLAVSKWRPHKRLTDIIESFLLAKIPDTYLYVIGDTTKSDCCLEKYSINSNVIFMGNIKDRQQLFNYYYHAIASIHLCWFDACPNTVVEAVGAGCPVITNNTGGTHEIVKPSGGIVLDIDKPYNYSPIDLYNPPAVDRRLIADAMEEVYVRRPRIIADHVSITNIAEQYKTFFQEFV